MSEKIKVGDVVQLKSGSENMVVKSITEKHSGHSGNGVSPDIPPHPGGLIVCLWRNNRSGQDCEEIYDPELLEKVVGLDNDI